MRRENKSVPITFGWLASRADIGTIKTIARHAKTVQRIAGLAAKETPKIGSVPLNYLHRAVNNFRRGRKVAALAAARAALECVAFGCQGITPDELSGKGIDPSVWKRECVEVLLEANSEVDGETFVLWGRRVADFVQKRLAILAPTDKNGKGPQKIRLPRGGIKTKIRHDYLVATTLGLSKGGLVTVQTVHAVKGETHDLTVFVNPDPTQENRCPSVVWWSGDPANQEERRIAFVAVTRTCGNLIVCVSKKCLARLQRDRAGFVQAFECMSIDDLIGRESGRLWPDKGT